MKTKTIPLLFLIVVIRPKWTNRRKAMKTLSEQERLRSFYKGPKWTNRRKAMKTGLSPPILRRLHRVRNGLIAERQ
ncbi:MAG: hypothetical protein ACP5TE_12440 [Verrucomicrobiia bacterium]